MSTRKLNIERIAGRSLLPVTLSLAIGLASAVFPVFAQSVPTDGSVLPFPAEPMKGVAQPRLQDPPWNGRQQRNGFRKRHPIF
jgi:hypothetical protein